VKAHLAPEAAANPAELIGTATGAGPQLSRAVAAIPSAEFLGAPGTGEMLLPTTYHHGMMPA
jgi:hypothetical protein